MRLHVASLGLVLALAPVAVDAGDGVRDAAHAFGRALTSGKAQQIRPLLPERGKVRLKLDRLGPEDGFFGAGQVEAILSDFLSRGSVAEFEIERSDSDDRSYGLVRGRARIVDREGRTGRVGLHLSFERDDGRWVLRELKETKP